MMRQTFCLIRGYLPVFMVLLTANILSCSCNKTAGGKAPPVVLPTDTTQNKPAIQGRLVYHNYTCYDCNDSQLQLFDFSTHTRKTLSTNWPISNPMNAHFSPDGRRIVFMGISPATGNWDIFIWTLGSSSLPENISATHSGGRNEDPKFSADGTGIIFKNNGVMTLIDTLGIIKDRFLTPNGEASMPYFTQDNKAILYASSQDGISSIYSFHLADHAVKTLYSAAGIFAYYPIARDDSSFLFTRWHSASNHHDQLYLGFYDGQPPFRPGFNEPVGDYSDAFPVAGNYILLSSTRTGSIGGYDLYVADMKSGAIWSLNLYDKTINTALNELGAAYHD